MEQLNLFNKTDEFFDIVNACKRAGCQQFIDWLLDETDYFEAPSSTRYHGAEKGGLLAHSLQVFIRLREIAPAEIPYDSIIICGLFHDVCKVNMYTESTRNVKNKETGKWEQVPYYAIDEIFPYGAHGGKSVYLLMSHGLILTDAEAMAINCHMGGWDSTAYHNPSKAFDINPLALYLHIADMIASHYDHK